MGRRKALLKLSGRTFLMRSVDALSSAVSKVVLLGPGPLPALAKGLTRLDDVPQARGPLAGMLAAFLWAPAVAWVFVGCDQPLVCAPAVRWLLKQRRSDVWAVLPRIQPDGIEPLLALYEPQARSALERLAQGSASLQELAGQPGVATPSPPPALASAWRNVNTPVELRALQQSLD
jgi:molybdopterin-guanine dinucleotide biosynthesis protein A